MMTSYWLIIMIYPDGPLFAVVVEFIIPASEMIWSRCDDFGCVVFHSCIILLLSSKVNAVHYKNTQIIKSF